MSYLERSGDDDVVNLHGIPQGSQSLLGMINSAGSHMTSISTSTILAPGSDTVIPTQLAVKSYCDGFVHVPMGNVLGGDAGAVVTTIDIYVTHNGHMITLNFHDAVGPGIPVPTGIITMNIPLVAGHRPARDYVAPCIVTDNGIDVPGQITVTTLGVINWNLMPPVGVPPLVPFVATPSANGIVDHSVTYWH